MAGDVYGRRQRREERQAARRVQDVRLRHAGDVTGAALEQLPDRAFNPAVPPAVIAELAAYQKKLATGELKLAPTREDARGGK